MTQVDIPTLSAVFALHACEPNPLTRATTLRFDLPRGGPIDLAVYDLSGRRVATILKGEMGPGTFARMWRGVDDRGRRVGAGVYIARLESGLDSAIRKMVLVR